MPGIKLNISLSVVTPIFSRSTRLYRETMAGVSMTVSSFVEATDTLILSSSSKDKSSSESNSSLCVGVQSNEYKIISETENRLIFSIIFQSFSK